MLLNPEIQEFIDSLRELKAVGCVLAPAKSLSGLASRLQVEVPCLWIRPKDSLPPVSPPAVLLASEEEYSANPDWAEEVRNVAGYFINLI